MSKILVTGGLGFIGSALTKELIRRGHQVTVFDNARRGKLSNLGAEKKNVRFIMGDIRDARLARKACRGQHTVYHLAAVNGTRYFYDCPDQVLDINSLGMIAMIQAALKEKCQKFIFSSSSELYQLPKRIPTPETEPVVVPDVKNPRFTYSTTKLLGEMYCLHYVPPERLDTRVVRYHNIYGPAMGFEHVIPQIVENCVKLSRKGRNKKIHLPLQGAGRTARSFCHINDAVEATLLVGERGKNREIYNIGQSLEETQISSLARMIAAELGLGLTIKSSPLPAGSIRRRCPSTRVLSSLGYRPKVSLRQGLPGTVRWYADHFLGKS